MKNPESWPVAFSGTPGCAVVLAHRGNFFPATSRKGLLSCLLHLQPIRSVCGLQPGNVSTSSRLPGDQYEGNQPSDQCRHMLMSVLWPVAHLNRAFCRGSCLSRKVLLQSSLCKFLQK